jgi:hypothetical protein
MTGEGPHTIRPSPIEQLEAEALGKLDAEIVRVTSFVPYLTNPVDARDLALDVGRSWVFAGPLLPRYRRMIVGRSDGPVYPIEGFTEPIEPPFRCVFREYQGESLHERFDRTKREGLDLRNALSFLGAERVPCVTAAVIPNLGRFPAFHERPDILEGSMQRDDWFQLADFILTAWGRLVEKLQPQDPLWRAVSLLGAAFWSEDLEISWLYTWRALELTATDELQRAYLSTPGVFGESLKSELAAWKAAPKAYLRDPDAYLREVAQTLERTGTGVPRRRPPPASLMVRASFAARGPVPNDGEWATWRVLRDHVAHGGTIFEDYRQIVNSTGLLLRNGLDLVTTRLVEGGVIEGVRRHDHNLSCLRPAS